MMPTMPRAKPTSRRLGATFGRGSAGGCAITIPSLHERRRKRGPPNSDRELNGEACAKVAQKPD
ncbi:hypothetical protein RHECNPAF_1760067 [Rhizobium etli CNPAF512]|nr:hypothetical protein RHECNPAF_1760067 [Rhizobium etli CNPAF512]